MSIRLDYRSVLAPIMKALPYLVIMAILFRFAGRPIAYAIGWLAYEIGVTQEFREVGTWVVVAAVAGLAVLTHRGISSLFSRILR